MSEGVVIQWVVWTVLILAIVLLTWLLWRQKPQPVEPVQICPNGHDCTASLCTEGTGRCEPTIVHPGVSWMCKRRAFGCKRPSICFASETCAFPND